MEKKLIFYFLRHGEAEFYNSEKHSSDDDRPLSEEGRSKIKAAGKGFREVERAFDRVLTSPVKRAVETAEVFLEGFGQDLKPEEVDFLFPFSMSDEFIESFKRLNIEGGKILFVGHNPILQEIVSRLLDPRSKASVKINPGTLVKIEMSEPAEKSGKVDWVLEVDDMIASAKPPATDF